MLYKRSSQLFKTAKKYIPGGVNSPVRAFNSVGGNPIFVTHAKGAYLYDVDGNKYIDFISSWGPMILGHAHPEIINEINSLPASLNLFFNFISFGSAPKHQDKNKTSGEKLCTALQGMGTTFIKLGQFLATRPDIIGEELSRKLENLQDRLPPFSLLQAKEIIKNDFYEWIIKENDIDNFIKNNSCESCYAEDFIDGTMINLFYYNDL